MLTKCKMKVGSNEQLIGIQPLLKICLPSNQPIIKPTATCYVQGSLHPVHFCISSALAVDDEIFAIQQKANLNVTTCLHTLPAIPLPVY